MQTLKAIAALGLMAAVPCGAAAAQLQLSTGLEFSSGNYGEVEATQTLVVPLAARVSVGGWSFRASVPFVRVRGPADVTIAIEDGGGDDNDSGGSGSGSSGSGGSGSDRSGTGGSTGNSLFAANREESGVGDASFAIGYSMVDIAQTNLYVDLTARVRVPTGNEATGLGSGTTDYAALTEIGWDGRKGGIYVGGGRRFLGNQPDAVVSRIDGWQANTGFWRRMGPKSLVGMQANWRNASVDGGEDPKSIDVYLTRRLTNAWKMEVSGGAGLSDANAAYVVGVNFFWRTTARRQTRD
jgi:hypothetical protein